MINIITMETVACLRSKCHLKQNLIPSWPWSFRHISCISDFRCKTKYTNKKFCRPLGPAYLAVLTVLVIFYPFGPTNFKKSSCPNFFYKNQRMIISNLCKMFWLLSRKHYLVQSLLILPDIMIMTSLIDKLTYT